MRANDHPDLVGFRIVFRDKPEPVDYQATADVLTAIARDWELPNAITKTYHAFSRSGAPCTLMLRFDDILYIG